MAVEERSHPTAYSTSPTLYPLVIVCARQMCFGLVCTSTFETDAVATGSSYIIYFKKPLFNEIGHVTFVKFFLKGINKPVVP
jgi:hypothetical protein